MNIVIIRRESQALPFTFSPHPTIHPSAARSRRSRPLPGCRCRPRPAAPRRRRPPQVGQLRPGRPQCAPRGRPRSPGACARPPPAGPRSPPGPRRRRSPPGRRHRGGSRTGFRPGRDPPRHAPHVRRRGAQPPTWTARRRSAALEPPITRPSALRSGPIGLHQVRRSPCRRPLGPRGQPAIASSPACADRLRDPGTHPGHPRSVPAPPAVARTHERAYDRRVSDFSSGLDFGIENWARASLPWSGTPGYRGIGRWDPPGRSGPTGPKLSACSDGIPGRAMAYAWRSSPRLQPSQVSSLVHMTTRWRPCSPPFTNHPGPCGASEDVWLHRAGGRQEPAALLHQPGPAARGWVVVRWK